MSLELRCPKHPGFTGVLKPGSTPALGPMELWNMGAQSCRDCWELYRRHHEGAPPVVLDGLEGGS